MTVICEMCHKIGEIPDPWPEDADIIEKLGYRMPTVFCNECMRKLTERKEKNDDKHYESRGDNRSRTL